MESTDAVYRVPAFRRFLPLIAVLIAVTAALFGIAAARRAGGPRDWIPMAVLAVALPAIVLPVVLRRSTLATSAGGITRDPGGPGEELVPWTSITGARRAQFTHATVLLDSTGTTLVRVSDDLERADQLLTAIADRAALVPCDIPSRIGMRPGWKLLAPLVALMLLGFVASMRGLELVEFLPFVVVLLVFMAAFAATSVLSVELDEAGLTIRRVFGRREVPWPSIESCGFRVMQRSRQGRETEPVVTSSGRTFAFVPVGGPALQLVATIRRRLAARGATRPA
jgi:hypothetical protein